MAGIWHFEKPNYNEHIWHNHSLFKKKKVHNQERMQE